MIFTPNKIDVFDACAVYALVYGFRKLQISDAPLLKLIQKVYTACLEIISVVGQIFMLQIGVYHVEMDVT